MKKLREDTQPEWPEAASEQDPSPTGRGTQAFPETGGTKIPSQPGSGIPGGSGRSAAVTDGTRDRGRGARGVPDTGRAGRADILASPGGFGSGADHTGPAAAVRDPWQEADASGSGQEAAAGRTPPAHDPHEVTVQLDNIGQHLEDLLVRQAKGGGPGGPAAAQDGSDGPVFVDESGRRSRRFRRIGIAVGLACGTYAVVIVATLLSGNSNAAWLPVPGQDEGRPAGKVDTPPLPAESALPSGVGGISPGPTPTAGQATGTAPAPGASAPRATTSPDRQGTPTATAPTPTGTATGPGTNPTVPNPTPTPTPPVTPTPTPTPTDTGPTATPTQTTGTGDGGDGPGTVADGTTSPAPVATASASPGPTDPEPSTSSSSILIIA
ncbi:hypothetical protein SLINC_3367 [Streptomyces lincolnensis]|uniref:Uncharacterized protein n=1 Tax=Streptomyces lincolnensis TaxID=1915 RepID=A0A1B1MAD6_STRLN|nr:hypothetical protein SLINC_3367 [Streptomyces lincolnensis]AXG54645.1 hypothetical protein SLCG_3490 [Streptomyces lincolnensis]